jgi:putative phosphoesterase
MQVALLSDIHGNVFALNAVLKDIAARGGADAYWILGDLVALGPEPIRTLDILASLPNTHFIRGNTDRYVCNGDRPSPTIEEARRNPELLGTLVEVANTFAWTQGMVTATGWLKWLQELPLEMRVTLPDGARFLGVHASPGTDDGPGISPDITQLNRELAGANADLICVGHTHRPFEKKVESVHVVNPGAVSLSLTEDKHACYALLSASAHTHTIEHRRVPYDRAAAINRLEELNHPGRKYLVKQLPGRPPAAPNLEG